VSTRIIQLKRRLMDFIMASTQPLLLQNKMCEHVLWTWAQLGHSGQSVRSQGRFPLAGAMSITCLQAQIWNILGTRRRAVCTISQSTKSNCCPKRILASWNLARASCQ
jgi:hypothetical protein